MTFLGKVPLAGLFGILVENGDSPALNIQMLGIMGALM
jgi:hypothetical protein